MTVRVTTLTGHGAGRLRAVRVRAGNEQASPPWRGVEPNGR